MERKARLHAMVEMTPKPSSPSLFLDRREGAPHRRLADDSLHVEKLRQDAVAAQCRKPAECTNYFRACGYDAG